MKKTSYYNDKASMGRMYSNMLYDSHLKALKEIYFDRRSDKRKKDFRLFSKKNEPIMNKTRDRLRRNYTKNNHKRNQKISKENHRLIRKLNTISNRATFNKGSVARHRRHPRYSRSRTRKSRTENSQQLRRNRTMEDSNANKNRNLMIKGRMIRKRMFYRKIINENHKMSKRINTQKSSIQMRKLEDQFKKNRKVLNRMKRYKFDPVSKKNVMNTCMIFTEGRFRMSGKKYMSYTATPKSRKGSSKKLVDSNSKTRSLRGSRKGSRRSSRRSLRSRKSSSKSLSREFKMGRVSKLKKLGKIPSSRKSRAVSSKTRIRPSNSRNENLMKKSRSKNRKRFLKKMKTDSDSSKNYIDFGAVKSKHINI